MGYFSNNYNQIKYPMAEEGKLGYGLRKAQIGAIHQIGGHFTVSKKPGIVIMPTGAGKTAVLMMSPFVLRANRVLVITPSRLVRNQISQGFAALQPLRSLGVISINPSEIRVKELKQEVTADSDWAALSNFHVVVSTPKCISPDKEGILPSDPNFFDLILIDEAHHTPAKSWMGLLDHYIEAKKILFTATPFRRDKKEIPGKIIYNYPVSMAFEDGIFGKTQFYPVDASVGDDAAIARTCEHIFRSEPKGTLHYVMVRTDSKLRAKELDKIYKTSTNLRLEMIHSGFTTKAVESTLQKLKDGQLDGIICVDMLGEGFDFPNLKIAAIHSPHKSLAATLQFIGRFTRTNAENITYAKFIAIPAEIEIEKQYLYRTNSVWRELIIEMSETKIETEITYRELIDGFQVNEEVTEEEYEELSPSSIEPYYHVKIYTLNQGEFACDRSIDVSSFGFQIIYRKDNLEENMSMMVLEEITKPKWSKGNTLQNVLYHLVIVYFDRESSLLFINSTLKKSIDFYELLFHQFCSDAQGSLLSDRELNSVLANISEAEFFNVGLRNRSHYGTNESYRIIAGQTAHNSINKSDVNNFHRGHLFGKGNEDGSRITIGLSSSSKVWSNRSSNLLLFLRWAKIIGDKVNKGLDGKTHTPVDDLPTAVRLTELPNKQVVVVNWHESAFRSFIKVIYSNEGQSTSLELTDIVLKLNHSDSDKEHYRFWLQAESFTLPVFFSYNYDKYFTSEAPSISDKIVVYKSQTDKGMNIMDYLNTYPLVFYYEDFSVLSNNHIYLDELKDRQLFPKENLDSSIKWQVHGVNIENECDGADCIHQFLKDYLSNQKFPFTYYDHGSGEVADFITAELDTNEILIKLYHCKGSSATSPGNRVVDIYEVVQQGIKSLNFTNYTRLLQKLEQRQKGKQLIGICRDQVSVLADFIKNNRGIKVGFQIILVQPGITKSGIESKISHLLSAANFAMRNTNNCRDLIVITSE